ncbi:Na(+)-translocating NADH-quinone reductase subunit C [Ferrimonas sediminicola]|uniref:Na(+)-translocating NADH-quinone reductase subunit C n=1 Tax=Ferrimonas sediminicola TaxID=2569538 RepID=A0A4U1BEQ0_9GAMM|nr:Na(+)-translocating NADH-quinone reductase subunit C [Ferrimonas sediminicola]TKB49704.1 Na(+)-translocating NADH-quinone reductase subunit C [Ferrimonas sediminicola]
MAKSNDSFGKTLGVVIGLCLVCSLVVSSAAVALKPLQEKNKAQDTQKYILEAANLMDRVNGDVASVYDQYIEAKVVDLATGQFDGSIDADAYDQRKAARDTATSVVPQNDIASIKRRASLAKVYLVKNDAGELDSVILPVHGYGLWSTMYAFLALEPDMNTVKAMVYYDFSDSGETPGLGGEVQNPKWKALWVGKKLFDNQGDLKIRVAKMATDKQHDVDALSGATLTSNGVQNTLMFWLGDEGFGPFIANARQGGVL